MNLSLSFSLRSGVTLICAIVAGANVFADYVVNSTGDAPLFANRGNICETSFLNGVCTLRAAIQASNNIGGTNITFNIPKSDPGYSNGVWEIGIGGSLPDITSPINISGPGATTLVINGLGDYRPFNVTTSGTVSISGVTVAFGTAPNNQNGGGIQNVNAGTVSVTNCTLRGNRAGGNGYPGYGGGIYNGGGGIVNVTNSTLEFNQQVVPIATNILGGGGIYNKNGTVNVTNSTFNNNNSTNGGGGIYNESGIINVSGSTFSGNGAFFGGGAIISSAGTVNIANSTFYANIAYGSDESFGRGSGGAIANLSKSILNLTNTTITANFAGAVGGGITSDNTFGAIANVKNTIIAGNYGGKYLSGENPDVSGRFTSHGFNLIGKKDGSTGFTLATDKKGTIASPLNPKLDPKGLRSNGGPTQTVALVAGSPAIDKGTSVGLTGTLSTDQRGFARKVDKSGVPNATGGDGTDIGAFELP